MFSLFLQVLNTLHLIESRAIRRQPVALFGAGCIYFQTKGYAGKQSVWEYFFEPLSPEVGEKDVLDPLGIGAFALLESVRKDQEYRRGLRDFPDRIHLVASLSAQDRENVATVNALPAFSQAVWTEDFNPTIDGMKAPGSIQPAIYSDLVRRRIGFQPHMAAKIADFHDRHLRGSYVVGVHVRGTDGHSSPARGREIPFDAYFGEIDRKCAEVGQRKCRILLATDEESYVRLFRERYGDRLVCYDAIRSVAGDDVFGKGPTGQVLPAYITADPSTAIRNGEDVVVEYGLLRQCDFFVHNESSISTAVRLSVPEAKRV